MWHVTGSVMRTPHGIIQRCPLCGLILADSRNTAIACDSEGSVGVFPTWEPDHWIEVTDSNPRRMTIRPWSPEPNPEIEANVCLNLNQDTYSKIYRQTERRIENLEEEIKSIREESGHLMRELQKNCPHTELEDNFMFSSCKKCGGTDL